MHPGSPRTIMSRFLVEKEHVSQPRFTRIPPVGGAPAVVQALCSLGGGSERTPSFYSSQHGASLDEGDLVTGTVDISHERAHIVPAIRDGKRNAEKKALVRANFYTRWTIQPNVFISVRRITSPPPCESSTKTIWTTGVWTTPPTRPGVCFQVSSLNS